MKLTHKQALGILGISYNDVAEINEAVRNLIKTMYRKACSQYHPDRNPAGLEMMKLVNQALESLGDVINGGNWDYSLSQESVLDETSLGEEMNAAINAIIGLGLTIEVCGTWIWVSGDTKPHKEILKAAGYKWAPKKMLWHWRPADSKSYSRGKYTMDEIRTVHGSLSVKSKSFARLQA